MFKVTWTRQGAGRMEALLCLKAYGSGVRLDVGDDTSGWGFLDALSSSRGCHEDVREMTGPRCGDEGEKCGGRSGD